MTIINVPMDSIFALSISIVGNPDKYLLCWWYFAEKPVWQKPTETASVLDVPIKSDVKNAVKKNMTLTIV